MFGIRTINRDDLHNMVRTLDRHRPETGQQRRDGGQDLQEAQRPAPGTGILGESPGGPYAE